MECLTALKKEGKIRAIGVSNANVDHLRAYGAIESDQEKFSLLDRGIEQNGLLDYCRTHNIAMLAYSPLANGLLTGKISPDRKFGEGDLRRLNFRFAKANLEKLNATLAALQPIADRHGATIAQLVIAWTIARPGITCVLCGARNAAQAHDNAQAGGLQLSPDELAAVENVVGSDSVETISDLGFRI